MTPINRKTIKVLTFSYEIPNTLQYKDQVLFQGAGKVIRIIGDDNEDESQDITYVVKAQISEIRKADTEIAIPTKVKQTVHDEKSKSYQLRMMCLAVASKLGMDAEKLYTEAIQAGRDYVTEKENEILSGGMR